MLWVVCYDIPSDKRRRKVMKLMEGYGRRAQYSVFECDLTLPKLERLCKRMRQLINTDEDDVRFYPLNRADIERAIMLGRAELYRRSKSDFI